MSILWIRGPVRRTQINEMLKDAMKEIYAIQASHPKIDGLFDKYDRETGNTASPEMREDIKKMMIAGNYSIEFNNSQHLMMFDSFPGFANLFFGQNWTVFISKSDKKFITSDNPVAEVSPKRVGFYGPTFLEKTHYFALTPEICIMAWCPMKDSGSKLRRQTLLKSNEKQILELNMTISRQAYQYTYATERQSLEDILEEVRHQDF